MRHAPVKVYANIYYTMVIVSKNCDYFLIKYMCSVFLLLRTVQSIRGMGGFNSLP